MTKEFFLKKWNHRFAPYANELDNEFEKDLNALILQREEPVIGKGVKEAEPPKYKLNKDLPDAKAGAIAHWDEEALAYKMEKNVWVSPNRYNWYSAGTVAGSPNWFERVVEAVYPRGILEFTDFNGNKHSCDFDAVESDYQSFCSYHLGNWSGALKSNITRVRNKGGYVLNIGDLVYFDQDGKKSEICKVVSFDCLPGGKITVTTEYWFGYIDSVNKSVHSPRTFTESAVIEAIEKVTKIYSEDIYGHIFQHNVRCALDNLKQQLGIG